MKFEFPYKGAVDAKNEGDMYGAISYSRGIDFSTEPGRILNSPNALKLTNGNDLATFTAPVSAFAIYDQRWHGAATKIFRNASGGDVNPTTTWSLDTTTSTPTIQNIEADMVYFDGSLRLSGVNTGDIYTTDGATWSSWWKGTLAQSALSTGDFVPLCVGPSGHLYILDNQQKVYYVTSTGTVAKTGGGTLDLSATGYRLQCMRATSTRIWLAGRDTSDGKSVVIEWDASENEASANRIHRPGSNGVMSIVIWNDSPVLMLTDGTMRFFDGAAFYSLPGARLPAAPAGYVYRPDLVRTSTIDLSSFTMHPNGSAVIDELPHFLMAMTLRDSSNTNVRAQDPKYYAGVFCYDPEIGLYNRFPIELDPGTTGFGANLPIGTTTLTVGALQSAPSQKTSFIASCMVHIDGDTRALIFSDDKSRSLAARGFFVLNPFVGNGRDLWQKVEVLCSKLKNSSDRILLKYRLGKSANLPFMATGTLTSSTTFTSTDTDFADVVEGDWVYISYGSGAGCTAHVSSITNNAGTYTVTLDESVVGYTSANAIEVIVDNFKRLATIDAQNTDYHDPAIANTESSHTFWLMVELRSAAGSVVELDKVIVTSENS